MSCNEVSLVAQVECSSFVSNFSKFQLFLGKGRFEKVQEIYNSIVQECTETGCRDHLFTLHETISDYFQKNGQLTHKLAAYTLGYYYYQASKKMPEALGVEQNEYAISSEAPIGTASVGECVCLCLKKKDSNEILVAHIDRRTSQDSINRMLDEFVTGPTSGFLIGGSDQSEELLEISKQNVEKIKNAISAKKDMELEEKTINTPHPTSFVFDLDGKIHENVYPGELNTDRMARNGIAAKTGMRPIKNLGAQSPKTLSPILAQPEEVAFAKEEISAIDSNSRSTSPVYRLELESLLLTSQETEHALEKIQQINTLLKGQFFDDFPTAE